MRFETVPFFRKTWGALSAIASSILTSIIYDEFSSPGYEAICSNGKLQLNQIEEYGFWGKCLLIILIFLLFWTVISLVIPFAHYVLKRFRYRNKRQLRKADILEAYQSSKKDILRLVEKGLLLDGTCCNDMKMLYTEEISLIVIRLYKTFCPGKKLLAHLVKSTFRTGETVYEIGRYISPFEYNELICTVEKLLGLFADSHNKMLKSDYSNLQKQLNELKQIMENPAENHTCPS